MTAVDMTWDLTVPPEEALAWVQGIAASADSVVGSQRTGATTLEVRSAGYTTGQITCMILLFPIGLLLLLNKRTFVLLATVREAGGRTTLRLQGQAHPKLTKVLLSYERARVEARAA